ncbi:PASTA domain-containing protein [bacterium]|nr:PASTA domain-containing protein [bacterium]
MAGEGLELLEKLSSDTLSVCYKARKGGTRYHLVVIQPPLDEARKKSFIQIVDKLKGLEHPQLAKLVDYYLEENKAFLIYEELRGMPLKDRLKMRAPFPTALAVDMALAIGEALSALHKIGLVHGDLYPNNVIVTPEGNIKLINAGIFVPFYDYIKKGDFSLIMDRAPYTAPEIARGAVQTPQSDIFSLGAILFEALTGSPPFEGPDPLAIVAKQTSEPAPSPRKLNPGVPRALEGVVLKALQKDLDKRYASIDQMLDDLKAIRNALRFGLPLSWSPMDEEVQQAPPHIEEKREPIFIKSAVFIIWSLIGLALLFLFLYAFLGVGKPAETVVPDLRGKTLEDAQYLLAKNGLKLGEIIEKESETLPQGYIISTQPPAGNLVRKGRKINLIVSTGAPYVVLPDLRSLEEERARKLLEDLGLQIGDVSYVPDRTIPFGQVISQSPAPQSRVAKGTQVNLKVSLGPPVEATTPTISSPSTQGNVKSATVRFSVPDSAASRKITIEVEDDNGKRIVYEEMHKPGDIIDQQVEGEGAKVTIRVYIDDTLMKEETLK